MFWAILNLIIFVAILQESVALAFIYLLLSLIAFSRLSE